MKLVSKLLTLGEGKTLVAALAGYLNAIPGKGAHVVTANDYLARRDAEQIGRILAGSPSRSGASWRDRRSVRRLLPAVPRKASERRHA